MNNNNFPIYFSLAVVIGILIGVFFFGDTSRVFSLSNHTSQEQKIKRLINFIEKDYVDKVDTDELLDEAITKMLDKLDPHSIYIPKENQQANIENMQGNFVGVGIQFRMIEDSITVIQPIKGGPSIKAGIKAGDRILIADNDTLYGKKLSANVIPNYLKGKPNTNLKLQIYRKSNDSLFSVDLIRDRVNIKSVIVSYMLNENLGYIKLDRFARNTYSEFKQSITKLIENGMTDLILDLRGNGGGYVDIANSIIDEFLEEDKLMLLTKNNKGTIHKDFATKGGCFEKGNLYVFIDEGSASASEILAGALQDNDKGTIIGRRSFGKGLIQEEIGLGDGSAVRLTIGRYYTPTGRSIQRHYSTTGGKRDYYKDYQNRITNGELLNKDSIKVVDSLKFTTPKGKVVYGGGGIIPDVFVPIDTTYVSNFYFNSINNFAFDYVDRNRKNLEKLSLNSFLEKNDPIDVICKEYLDYLKKESTIPKRNKVTNIRKSLKITVASLLFGDEGLFKVSHKDDSMILKVLELEANKE